jgi:nickel-dependent lactate racemase
LNRDIFLVNAAMNEDACPIRFFCGHPVDAQRRGEAFVAEAARLEVPEQADVVLANSFPMEADLRQSVKCLGNTLEACRPEGVMLGCVKCSDGLGRCFFLKKRCPTD